MQAINLKYIESGTRMRNAMSHETGRMHSHRDKSTEEGIQADCDTATYPELHRTLLLAVHYVLLTTLCQESTNPEQSRDHIKASQLANAPRTAIQKGGM